MKQTLTTEQAADILLQDDNAAWTYKGARALIEHLEQMEEETGQEIEMDRIALRCEFTEYASALEAANNYTTPEELDVEELDDEEEIEEKALEYLQYNTMVIEFKGGVIIQDF